MALLWMDGFDHYLKHPEITSLITVNDGYVPTYTSGTPGYVPDSDYNSILALSESSKKSLSSALYTTNEYTGNTTSGSYLYAQSGMYIIPSDVDGDGYVVCLANANSSAQQLSRTVQFIDGKLYIGIKLKHLAVRSGSDTFTNFGGNVNLLNIKTADGGEVILIQTSDGKAHIRTVFQDTIKNYNTGDSPISDRFKPGDWNYVEMQVDPVDDKVRLWLNNRLCAEIALERTLSKTAPAGWDETVDGPYVFVDPIYGDATITLGGNSVYGNYTYSKLMFDNFYILDTTGAVNNKRLGIVSIATRKPTADVAVQFQPIAGTTNVPMIGDASPDGEESYVYSSDAGATDIFSTDEALPIKPIHAVGITVNARRTGGDSRPIYPVIKTGDQVYRGSKVDLQAIEYTMGTAIYNVNPVTSNAWSNASASDLNFGYQLATRDDYDTPDDGGAA